MNTIVLVTIHNLRSFSGSFASMLNDRLVPSAEIAQMQEFAFKNRLFLEHLVFRDDTDNLKDRIRLNNEKMDSIYQEFEKTYFTDEEGVHARNFLESLRRYRQDEQHIISLLEQNDRQEAERYYEQKSNVSFQEIISELQLLTGIQLTVGKMLYKDADDKINLIRLVVYFSLVISLVVAGQTLKVLGIRLR